MITAHPHMVHFDKTTCCALREGFRKNQGTIQMLYCLHPITRVNMHRDILVNSVSLGFVPDHEQEDVFGAIAKTEMTRLASDKTLDCACDPKEHIKALQAATQQLNR